MMSATHGQPILVCECGQIVRMRSVHDKSNQRAAFFERSKNTRSRQFADALSCITRKLRVVFENRRASDLLDVINRGSEPDGARDIGRTSLEPMRRFLKGALFKSDADDHFATAVPRRDGIENLRTRVKHADSGRSTHFVSGERQEIAAQVAHIDWHVSRALRRVHKRKRAYCMRLLAEFRDGIDCAQ